MHVCHEGVFNRISIGNTALFLSMGPPYAMYREVFFDCLCLTVMVKSTIKVTDVTMLISGEECAVQRAKRVALLDQCWTAPGGCGTRKGKHYLLLIEYKGYVLSFSRRSGTLEAVLLER